MKVGQITYCGNNYGSVLQCLATQTELKKHGLECVLLTRSEIGLGRVFQTLEFRLNRTWKMLRYPQHRQVFHECLQALKPNTGEDGLQEDAVAAINYFIQTNIRQEVLSWSQMRQKARSRDYAFFLSGSDQIWSAHWFITNRLWFLRFAPRQKRVAWMPSFGGEKLAEYNRTSYKKYIAQYASLSVREESGAVIVKDLLGISVPVLSDPVFLLSAEDWRSVSTGKERKNPYILMFFLEKPSQIALKQAQLLQEKNGYDIVYFSYRYNDCEGSFLSGGPEQFLYMIDHAQGVLTDSFHACAFSSIFSTPFYAFARSGTNGSRQMVRVKNLLNTLSMPQRYIESENSCRSAIIPIPQESVQNKLEDMRLRIQNYLNEVLQFQLRKEA